MLTRLFQRTRIINLKKKVFSFLFIHSLVIHLFAFYYFSPCNNKYHSRPILNGKFDTDVLYLIKFFIHNKQLLFDTTELCHLQLQFAHLSL